MLPIKRIDHARYQDCRSANLVKTDIVKKLPGGRVGMPQIAGVGASEQIRNPAKTRLQAFKFCQQTAGGFQVRRLLTFDELLEYWL
jgi:hypothetical protein